ncbi:MAG: DsbA family protein, partial [Rhizobiales bacterium]|nr:DsbA family protein [Hyphomicrobiales bacterium]
VGGLRVGGHQAWDAEFRKFLREHWQQVGQASGQEFNMGLLDLAAFNYDTEPACRAVVAAKNISMNLDLPNQTILQFYVAIQRKFYVDNQDPKQVDFYKSICADTQINFDDFKNAFLSDEIKQQTAAEFNVIRNWGGNGYPTLLVSDGKTLELVSSGYQKSEILIQALDKLLL